MRTLCGNQLVIGLDMYQQNLKNILQFLVKFEKVPKEIRGRIITEWFKIGESLFEEFYRIGANTAWDSTLLKNSPEVLKILQHVSKNQNWLQSFITIYPNLRLDFDGGYSTATICRVRSGLQFLLRGCQGINTSLNVVLKDLEEFGELDEFDSQLRLWLETGHRPEFFPTDKDAHIPSSHWWWF